MQSFVTDGIVVRSTRLATAGKTKCREKRQSWSDETAA